MKTFLCAWSAALASSAVLDAVWLGRLARPLYQREIGHLMAQQVDLRPAGLFYALYGAGIWYFCTIPALREGGLSAAATRGAALGLLVYGVYDLTNLAALRDWTLLISVADVAWGVFLTATASAAAYAAAGAASRNSDLSRAGTRR